MFPLDFVDSWSQAGGVEMKPDVGDVADDEGLCVRVSIPLLVFVSPSLLSGKENREQEQ